MGSPRRGRLKLIRMQMIWPWGVLAAATQAARRHRPGGPRRGRDPRLRASDGWGESTSQEGARGQLAGAEGDCEGDGGDLPGGARPRGGPKRSPRSDPICGRRGAPRWLARRPPARRPPAWPHLAAGAAALAEPARRPQARPAWSLPGAASARRVSWSCVLLSSA